MNDRDRIILCLEETPSLLRHLLSQIPEELHKVRRLAGKWSIHEHACHIATGDKIGFIDRIHQFIDEESPVIVPLSGDSFPPDHLLKMNLGEALDQFALTRSELTRLAASLDKSVWENKAHHPEYSLFTPHIMLRHRLMHDHLHMYRIQELWLLNPEFLECED